MRFLLDGLQPPAEHPPDFLQRALRLENFRLVHKLQFQTKPELEHGGLLMGARPDEIGRLERLWGVLRHDQFSHAAEDSGERGV